MLVFTIVTVLQFCKLRCEMLVRPINLSPWYCVKDNVVLQALCPSSNCLYTKSKFAMLRPLKGEVGYEYPHQNGKTPAQATLTFYYQIDLIPRWFFQIDRFFHLSMADNVIAFRCSSVIYPHLMLSPSYFQNSLFTPSIQRINGIPLWDFYASVSQRALKIIIIAELFIVVTASPG